LDEGQLQFLRGVAEPPAADDLMAWNRWAWLWPPWVYAAGDPDRPCPDGSSGPAELWAEHGREFVAEWRRTHPSEPHPLVEWLGEP
jgi:hypothetical protein